MEPQQYPVDITIPRQERSSRWLALAFLLFMIPKAIMVIPHFIVLYVLGVVAFVLTIVAQFIVLFTGSYPAGMHGIVSGTIRWQTRVNSYFLGLVDKYPPFSLK
jgi:VIT1/CCC1 family predicted Fe2+/Mn2+ transporter